MKLIDFKAELQTWMKNTLSPYCLNECKTSCCDCAGVVQIDNGYEYLFKTNKSTGKKIPAKKQNYKGAHLFRIQNKGVWYFSGSACPNYDSKNKKCLIHNQYPRCALYPIVKNQDDKGYTLFSVCSLHKLKETQEPLKSLVELCKKYGFGLVKEKIN